MSVSLYDISVGTYLQGLAGVAGNGVASGPAGGSLPAMMSRALPL